MPTLFEIPLYQYDELDDKAKPKARVWFEAMLSEDNWWGDIYQGLEACGVVCSYFDLDRRDINITLRFIIDAVAKSLHDSYGWEFCKNFDITIPDAEENFMTKLELFVLKLLQDEFINITSTEYSEEVIRANEYWFYKDGTKAYEMLLTKTEEA